MRTPPSAAALPLFALRAQVVFSYHRLQSVFIQIQVRHQLLQRRVFFAQRLHFLRFTRVHVTVLRLPGVDRLLADAVTSSDLVSTSASLYDGEVILFGWTDQFYFEINAIRRMSETDDRQKAMSACTIGTQPVIPAV